MPEHQARHFFNALQFIRRIGKYDIEGFGASFQEFEDIPFVGKNIFEPEFLRAVFNEAVTIVIFLYADDTLCTARCEFEADGACSAEKIEHAHFFQVKTINEDIEEAFLGEVGGGPQGQVARGFDLAAAVRAPDYAHRYWLSRL